MAASIAVGALRTPNVAMHRPSTHRAKVVQAQRSIKHVHLVLCGDVVVASHTCPSSIIISFLLNLRLDLWHLITITGQVQVHCIRWHNTPNCSQQATASIEQLAM